MDKLEKVEKIVEKTGVTYEEAKTALEACNEDVLDAIVWLERRGKTSQQTASYSAQAGAQDPTSAEMSQAQNDYEQATRGHDFADMFNKVLDWIKRVLKKSVDTSFVAERNGKQIFSLPVLLFVLLLIFAFWIVLPLLVISLFCNFRYHFEGIGTVVVDINEMASKVSDGAESIKQEFVNGTEQGRKDANAKDAGTEGSTGKTE